MFELIEEDSNKIVKNIDFNWFKNKSVLITGASGLIGTYLVSTLKLLTKNYNVKITIWVKNKILPELEKFFEGCEIITGDITNSEIIDHIRYFDCIVHSSGYGQPGKFLENKIKTVEINTTVTKKLLEKLNKNGKFLFISSSEIYSGLEQENIVENQIGTTNTDHIRSCYIEGKRLGETICHIFRNEGIDVKIARLSLAYGPGTKKGDHRVLNSIIEKGLTKKTIELLDSGSAVRTYCYITDVIEMFWNILLHGKDHTYNVGGESKVSIFELAEIIGNKLNKKVTIPVKDSSLLGNPKIVNISNQKYIEEFQKKEFVSLEEGLEKTINWQKIIYHA